MLLKENKVRDWEYNEGFKYSNTEFKNWDRKGYYSNAKLEKIFGYMYDYTIIDLDASLIVLTQCYTL